MLTLIGFIVVYTFVFGAGTYYIVKLIRKVPVIGEEGEKFYDHSMEASVAKAVTDGGVSRWISLPG